MTRAEIISNEIKNSSRASTYVGKTPSEIAIMMNEYRSKQVTEFTSREKKIEEIVSFLTRAKIQRILQLALADGVLSSAEVADVQQEIKTSITEIIGLDQVRQGDVEEALKL